MSVLKIKSITKLYDKYKILFLRQIKRNSFTKEIFEILHHRYTAHVIPPKESYFSIIKDMNNKYDVNIDVKMHHDDIKEVLENLDKFYKFENKEIRNKLNLLIRISGSPLYDYQASMEFKMLLTVNFN